jgi:hypothetical protein
MFRNHTMPYVIAEEVFPSKSALTERARSALARTPNGQPAGQTDTDFLIALFQHHDEWDKKCAGGVREITTQMTVHGTRCFILRRHDATEIDISFTHAIRLIPSARTADILPQPLRDFRSAARSAIQSQTRAFRDEALLRPQCCPVTGEQLCRSNAAVDHEPPNTFDALAFTFCKEHRINPLSVSIGSEGGVVAVFADRDLLHAWRSFHQGRASLRLISKIGNLRLPKPRMTWAELWS